jgi:hypothetical protein
MLNLGDATQREDSAGLGWDVVNSADATMISAMSFGQLYGWLFLDFLIYLLGALYLDNVLPSNETPSRSSSSKLTNANRSVWSPKEFLLLLAKVLLVLSHFCSPFRCTEEERHFSASMNDPLHSFSALC